MMTKSKNEINMLSGPLLSRMLLFAFPLIASGVLQQSFNSIDVAMVGHYTGSQALAAVGSTGPIIGLLINLFIGIGVGVNVVIANYIGQRNGAGVRKSVNATVILCLICGVLILLVGESMARPVLLLTGTPENVLEEAVLYMRIFVLGLPFMIIFNFGSAILRSVGDTRRPFYSLIFAGIIHVILNLIFVVGCDMGVAGVALGTVISNVINAGIIIVILMREKGDIRLDFKHLRMASEQLRKICSLGIPAGVQGAVFALSNTFILSAINSFGSNATAGSAAAVNFEFYCYFPLSAIAQTAVAFISQNYGAGNAARIKRVIRLSLLLGFGISMTANFLITWQGDACLSLFSSDPAVLFYGDIRLQTVLLFQFVASYYEITGSAMRGLGYSMTPTLIVIFGTCVLRLLWVFLFPYLGGDFRELLTVYPVSWLLTDICMFIAFRRVSRRALAKLSSATI